jgi:hypothetical protein
MYEFDGISSAPTAADGDYVRVNPADALGHTLLVWVIDYIPESPTRFTKPGDKSDVIVVDVVDLDVADPETGQRGLVGRKCWWRQAQLIRDLKDSIGRPNPKLGRIIKGVATKGLPPYVLEDARGDANAVKLAQWWLQAHPDFKPSESSITTQNAPATQTISQAPTPPMSQLEMMARQASQPPPDTQLAGGRGAYYGTEVPKPNLPPAPPLPDEAPF